tara:strand:- start:964 stop:1365 length:402 start_codon:yes stop_codon:yes gene_type:complete
MTQQVFKVGQKVIRVAPSNEYLMQGETYEVSYVGATGNWIDLVDYDARFASCDFRPAINIKPLADYEAPTMNTDDNEIDLAKFSHQTTIADLEKELGEAKEELEKMNRWWYEEKTKCADLQELVVKQATKLMA